MTLSSSLNFFSISTYYWRRKRNSYATVQTRDPHCTRGGCIQMPAQVLLPLCFILLHYGAMSHWPNYFCIDLCQAKQFDRPRKPRLHVFVFECSVLAIHIQVRIGVDQQHLWCSLSICGCISVCFVCSAPATHHAHPECSSRP